MNTIENTRTATPGAWPVNMRFVQPLDEAMILELADVPAASALRDAG